MSASDVSPVGVAASVLQTGLGVIQSISGNKKLKSALAQRKAYEIPDEIYKIVNAAQAGTGGDQQTLNYQTGQINQAGAASNAVAERLGADPNALSFIFNQQVNALGAAAEQNHATAMEQLGKVFQAWNLLAENKAAVWRSQQDIVKDRIQAASKEKDTGMNNIAGGINTAIAVDSAARTGALYDARTQALAGGNLATPAAITNNQIPDIATGAPQISNSLVNAYGANSTNTPVNPINWDNVNWRKN